MALERGSADFERVVALKRLLPEQARDPRHKQMFLREARLAALLRHPNVVHAFAFGELYGELFLAMEYVEGETLARCLAVGQEVRPGLDAATVAFVLAEVCDGLHAAHELRDEQGQPLHVVHRDVSPHNVMIAYDGHVKILDFGVAKFDTGGQETRTGEVKGKMAYMSPEQALGEKLDRPERSVQRRRGAVRVPHRPAHVGRRHGFGGHEAAGARGAAAHGLGDARRAEGAGGAARAARRARGRQASGQRRRGGARAARVRHAVAGRRRRVGRAR